MTTRVVTAPDDTHVDRRYAAHSTWAGPCDVCLAAETHTIRYCAVCGSPWRACPTCGGGEAAQRLADTAAEHHVARGEVTP